MANGYQKRINRLWPEIPGDIDAAVSNRGHTYFFKVKKKPIVVNRDT